jgi:hypothetical protein
MTDLTFVVNQMTQICDESKLISVCSPLFVTLKDGLKRLFEVIGNDKFVFVVTGEEMKLTMSETVLISSKVHENFRSSLEYHTFDIEDANITLNDFFHFLDFVHSGSCDEFSEVERFSFLSICKVLGNEGLTFLLLDSLGSKVENRVNFLTDSGMNSVDISINYNFNADHCASHFHEYSVDLIR